MKEKLKGFIVGVLVTTIIGCGVAFAANYEATTAGFKVFVNGKEYTSEPPALVVEGRTYLPLRAIGEALGVAVNWNEELRQAEVGTPPVINDSKNNSKAEFYPEGDRVPNLGYILQKEAYDVTTEISGSVTITTYQYNFNGIDNATLQSGINVFKNKLLLNGFVIDSVTERATYYWNANKTVMVGFTYIPEGGLYAVSVGTR